MKTSRYFSNLMPLYQAELDDLATDSEGNNVLKARLAKKRQQVAQLLMMLESAPEMVAVAFHGAFGYKQIKTLEKLISREKSGLIDWATLKPAVTIEPWAESLIQTVLTDKHGEHFLATTIGLEFLCKHAHFAASAVATLDEENERDEYENSEDYLSSDDRMTDEDADTESDLDRAGADFLVEQGFDRKE